MVPALFGGLPCFREPHTYGGDGETSSRSRKRLAGAPHARARRADLGHRCAPARERRTHRGTASGRSSPHPVAREARTHGRDGRAVPPQPPPVPGVLTYGGDGESRTVAQLRKLRESSRREEMALRERRDDIVAGNPAPMGGDRRARLLPKSSTGSNPGRTGAIGPRGPAPSTVVGPRSSGGDGRGSTMPGVRRSGSWRVRRRWPRPSEGGRPPRRRCRVRAGERDAAGAGAAHPGATPCAWERPLLVERRLDLARGDTVCTGEGPEDPAMLGIPEASPSARGREPATGWTRPPLPGVAMRARERARRRRPSARGREPRPARGRRSDTGTDGRPWRAGAVGARGSPKRCGRVAPWRTRTRGMGLEGARSLIPRRGPTRAGHGKAGPRSHPREGRGDVGRARDMARPSSLACRRGRKRARGRRRGLHGGSRMRGRPLAPTGDASAPRRPWTVRRTEPCAGDGSRRDPSSVPAPARLRHGAERPGERRNRARARERDRPTRSPRRSPIPATAPSVACGAATRVGIRGHGASGAIRKGTPPPMPTARPGRTEAGRRIPGPGHGTADHAVPVLSRRPRRRSPPRMRTSRRHRRWWPAPAGGP